MDLSKIPFKVCALLVMSETKQLEEFPQGRRPKIAAMVDQMKAEKDAAAKKEAKKNARKPKARKAPDAV